MISFLISALKIIFLLGFLIFIHEGGHFLVAKLCKVKVNEFAIGFGPTLLQKQGKETKYALRLIPLGGFVNMLGEEERSSDIGSFSEASIPKRMAIIVAGGFVNIIFGLIAYFILVSVSGNYISTKVESVVPNYAAEKYGIQSGDNLLKINDKKVRLKSDIDKAVQKSKGNRIKLTIERNNKIKEIYLIPTKEELDNIEIYKIGVIFAVSENSFINNVYYGLWDTVDFSLSIIDNLKLLFTGNVGVDQLTRTSWNIRSSIEN